MHLQKLPSVSDAMPGTQGGRQKLTLLIRHTPRSGTGPPMELGLKGG
jgi:hypothetical protein